MNYDSTPVDQGITYAPSGSAIFRVVLPFSVGPNANAISVAHGIADTSTIRVLAMHGSMVRPGAAEHFPIPYVTDVNIPIDPTGQNVGIAMDNTNVYVASNGDWSAYDGFVQIDYIQN